MLAHTAASINTERPLQSIARFEGVLSWHVIFMSACHRTQKKKEPPEG